MSNMRIKWICKKCGKVVFSTSLTQEKYNTELHMEMHKNKDELRKLKKEQGSSVKEGKKDGISD